MSLSEFVNKFRKKEETEAERRIKLEKRAFSKKNKSHRFSKRVFIIFFLFYGLFWTSRLWLPVQSSSDQPKIRETYVVNDNYSVKMIRYDYSSKDRVAEIELDILQTRYQNGEWQLSATQNGNPLNVEFPIDNEQNLIIRISDVKNETDPIAIILSFIGSDNKSTVTWNYKPKKVTQIENMPKKTPDEYRIQRCNLNIQFYEKRIKKYQKKIEQERKIIADIQVQNVSLEELLYQQTSEEQKRTNEQITENLAASNNAAEKIKKYENKIVKIDAKITGEKQKKERLEKKQ